MVKIVGVQMLELVVVDDGGFLVGGGSVNVGWSEVEARLT